MGLHWRLLFLYIGIALLLESNLCIAGVRISKASAQTLAQRTGAAHFEEHFEEIASSEESDEHNIRKRQSDEDFDYEVYQGVVGRPGIDFPVLPRIPQTQFSCRKFGNGYFADLETECQVFHICDDGRKISFLCPNGTIFQQTELICDWWFKVNCAASPGHYAESAEMLSRAQQNRHNQRQNQKNRADNDFHSEGGFQRPNVQVNGNKNQYPVKNSNKYEQSDRLNKDKKLNRRIDSDEDPSSENYDFEDISDDKKHHKIEKFTDKSLDGGNAETQELAESASFVASGKQRNGYNYGVHGQSTTSSGYNPNLNRQDEKISGNDKRGRGRFDVKDDGHTPSGKNVGGRGNGHQGNSQGSNNENEYSPNDRPAGFSTKFPGFDNDASTRGSSSHDRNQQRENSKHGSGRHHDDVQNQQNGRHHSTGKSRTTIEPTTTFSRGQSRHPTSGRQERKHSSTSDGKVNTLDEQFERKTTTFGRNDGVYSVDGGFSTISDNEHEFSTPSRNNNGRTSTHEVNGKKTTPVTKSRNNEHQTTLSGRGSFGTSRRPTGKPNLIDGDIDIFEGETTNTQGGFSHTTISASGINGNNRGPTGKPKSSSIGIGGSKLSGDVDIFEGDTTSTQGGFSHTTISTSGINGNTRRTTGKPTTSRIGIGGSKLSGDVDIFEGDTTSTQGGFSHTTISGSGINGNTRRPTGKPKSSSSGIDGSKLFGDDDIFEGETTSTQGGFSHTTISASGINGNNRRPTGKPNSFNIGIGGSKLNGDVDISDGETTSTQGGYSHTTISASGFNVNNGRPTGKPNSFNFGIGGGKLNGDIDIFEGETTSTQGGFSHTTISASGINGNTRRPTGKPKSSSSGIDGSKLFGDDDIFEGETTSTHGGFSHTTISASGINGNNRRPTGKPNSFNIGIGGSKLNGDVDISEGETTSSHGGFSHTTISASGIKGTNGRTTGKPKSPGSKTDDSKLNGGIGIFDGETTGTQGRFTQTTISASGIKGNNRIPTGKPNLSNSVIDDNKLNGEYGPTTVVPGETSFNNRNPTFPGKVGESDLNVSIFGGGAISPKGKSEQTTHSSQGIRGSTRHPTGRPHIGIGVDDSDLNASVSGDDVEGNQGTFSTGKPGITRIPSRNHIVNIDQNGEATTSLPGDEVIIGQSNGHHKGTNNQFGSSPKPNQLNRNDGPVKTKSQETDSTKPLSEDKNINGNGFGSRDHDTKTTNTVQLNGNQNNIHEGTTASVSSSLNGRRPSTYTTARKLDTTRTTPYYTPTVPTILSRFGETKTNSFESTTASPSSHVSGSTRTPTSRSTTPSRGYTVFQTSTLYDDSDSHFTATTISPRFSTISGSAVEISGDESPFSSVSPYLTNSLNNDLLPPRTHSTGLPHGSTISGGASSSGITPSPYGSSTVSVGGPTSGSRFSTSGYSTVSIPSLSLSSGPTNIPDGYISGVTNDLSSLPTTYSYRGSLSSTTSSPRFSTASGSEYLPRGSSSSSTKSPISQSSSFGSTYLPRGSSTTGKPSATDSTYHSTEPFTGAINDISFGKTQSPSNYVTTSKLSSSGSTYLPTESTAATTYRPSSSGPTYLPKSSSSGPTYLPRGPAKESSTNADGLESPVSEHIKEMIKTLNDLNVDTTGISGASKINGSRPFMIPPSSGPETLSALANYFATPEDISVTTDKSGTTPGYGDSKTEISAAHLSNKTVETYETLFGLGTTDKSVEPTLTPNFEPKFAFDSNDLEGQHSGTPFEDASGKPETRKIAEVFSNGLSEYLRDPNGTRQFLEGLRPTEPPTTENIDDDIIGSTTKKYFDKGTGATYLPTVGLSVTTLSTPTTTDDLEVLDFSDVTSPNGKKTSASHSAYTVETTTYYPTTEKGKPGTVDRIPASRYIAESVERNAKNQNALDSGEATTEYNPLAAEVNKGLGLSTVIPYVGNGESATARNPTLQLDILPPGISSSSGSTAQPGDLTSTVSSKDGSTVSTHSPLTFELVPPPGDKGTNIYGLPSSDILPPVSEEEEDTLQRAQSQSFVPSGNVLLGPEDRRDKTKASGSKPTNIPGHYITRLMSDNVVSTTEFPDIGKISPNPWSSAAYTVFLDPLTINDGLMGSQNFKPTTSSPFTYLPKSGSTTTDSTPVRFDLGGIVGVPSDLDKSVSSSTARTGKLIPDFPDHLLPPPNGMQKMANKMFGGLNETSADHLMSVMKKAEDNRSVRRLILLLIQTCDDDYSNTVEQSREALLNALIGMDGPLKSDDEVEIIKVHPNRRGKSISSSNIGPNSLTPTTSEIPITTYRRTTEYSIPTSTISSSSAEWSSSTTDTSFSHSTTSTPASSMEETTKFQSRTTEGSSAESGTSTTTQSNISQESHEATTTSSYSTADSSPISLKASSRRKAKDIESSLGQADFSHKNSDERALELLKSLYSLASKFYRR